MGRLENRIALVTGAGQGIGRAIALAMAREGAALVIGDLNEINASAVKKEIEGLEKDLQESKSRLQAEMNHTLKEIQERFSTEAKIKSEREQARIIEASKLQAK